MLDALDEPLAGGGSLILLTDFDGTLAPIAPDPAAVVIDDAARRGLAALAGSPRARVGVLSGRALPDIRRRVGLAGVTYGGCHGLEIEGPGLSWQHPDALATGAAHPDLVDLLRGAIGAIPGVLVEDKGLSVALHYRNAAPGTASRVEAAAAQARRRWPALALLRGKRVVEVLPDVGWNKGECALWLRDRWARDLDAPVATVCLGDDETDELAFRALAGEAITVRVGEAWPSAATHRLGDVSDVGRLLQDLARRVGGRP
jgi:trehalose-phosphatase